jgi:hypothetical protein
MWHWIVTMTALNARRANDSQRLSSNKTRIHVVQAGYIQRAYLSRGQAQEVLEVSSRITFVRNFLALPRAAFVGQVKRHFQMTI